MTISNHSDVIYCDAIVCRLADLKAAMKAQNVHVIAGDWPLVRSTVVGSNTRHPAGEMMDEFRALADVAAQAERAQLGNWRLGCLVRTTYVSQYAEQFAKEHGLVDPKTNWPARHINWHEAARDLLQSCQQVTFDGVPYFFVAPESECLALER